MNRLCPTCNKEFSNRGKLCTSCYQKAYYAKNKDTKARQKARYYKNNKEKIDEKSKAYCDKNRDKVRLKNRNHYKKNKEQILQYQKKYKVTPKRKFNQGKKSAIERNLSWSIDYQTYIELIKNPCCYCGNSLEKVGGVSLDRINNVIGYELTNVVPCCGDCNKIRNTFLSHEEMKIAMMAVLTHRSMLHEESSNTEPER